MCTGDRERLGAAHRAAEHECPLERGEHRDRELACLRPRDAGRDGSLRRRLDPALEHVRRRLAERLVRARDLEGDRRDRAGVGVVGDAQRLRRAREEVARRGDHVGRRIGDRLEELEVEPAREADHLVRELLFAAGKEVVQRAEWSIRLRNDLLEAGTGVALSAKELGARVDDSLLGADRPLCRLVFRLAEVELSAGTIEYEDTGGTGPVIVPIHGVTMNGSLWRKVVAELRADHRCVVPTMPLGGHRHPMRPDADLSIYGIAALIAEFLDRLDLRDVTLAMSDWGGPQLIASERRDQRVGRLVITSCEAFDYLPPGIPGRLLGLSAKLPGGLNALAQPLRLRPLRRLPIAFGWMSKRPVPDEVMDGWLRPLLTQRAIRRDLVKYIRTTDMNALVKAAEALRDYEHPALVVWAAEDRIMPPEHGRRLASLLPRGRLVEISDSYTLIPEDQPVELARAIRTFVRETQPEKEPV